MRRFPSARWVWMAAVLSMAALICGCASAWSMRQVSPLQGVPFEFDASFAETCDAARVALMVLGLEVVDEYAPTEATWAVVGSSGMSMTSYGEFVRITVEELSEGRCVARVYTKVKVATNVFAKNDYSADVLAGMLMSLEN